MRGACSQSVLRTLYLVWFVVWYLYRLALLRASVFLVLALGLTPVRPREVLGGTKIQRPGGVQRDTDTGRGT